MSDLLKKVAQPGDPDLDIDVDNVTLTAVVVEGREVLFRATGGFGAWIDAHGELAYFPPGDEDTGVEELTGTMDLRSGSDELFQFYVDLLNEWMERAVPLRFVGAPGRMFSLIEDQGRWLPLPRKWPPPR